VIVVRGATLSDVKGIVGLHLLAFPDYYTSHLGARFLRLFYAFFLERESSHCIVAVDGDTVIGFVAGTSDTKEHFSTFYRRKLVEIARIAAVGFLRDPMIRRESVKRAARLLAAAAARLRRRPQSPREGEESGQTPAQLLCIAVHPDLRGGGAAERLTAALIRQLRKDGACRVGLTVRSDNAQAIAFYCRDGWIAKHTAPEFVYFHRRVAEEHSA